MVEPPENSQEEWLRQSLAYVRNFSQLLSVELPDASVELDIPVADEAASGPPANCEVVLCSPHPDDEALTGSLPLRLRGAGAGVVNLAMTMGRDPHRREQRKHELSRSCRVLGFGNLEVGSGLGFTPQFSRNVSENDSSWQQMVDKFAQKLNDLRPQLIFFPHGNDAHPTHLAVHRLARQAALLYAHQAGQTLILVETEYWHPMRYPNLLVGVTTEEVARLVCAVSQHRGELARTPYHLLLPARFADNVRRGGELLEGFGGAAQPFLFGELYRLSCCVNGKVVPLGKNIVLQPGKEVSVDSLARLFEDCDGVIKAG